MSEQFHFFWSGPFSQWYPCTFTHGIYEYNCAEQFMMQKKALFFEDHAIAAAIMQTSDPKEQKALGRKVANFSEERWKSVAKKIVYVGSRQKYTQNTELKRTLMRTGTKTLVEASPYDTIWGIGLKKEDPRALNRATWRGTNWLGEVLTQLRDDLTNIEGYS